jgi:streptomycin 6-kinase
MADNDDDAAIERAARRIFELQNPGKPWPPGPLASAEDRERYRQLARKERDAKEG